MTSQPARRFIALIRLLALVTLSLAGLAALLPAHSVYAAPILRLRLELAPGTPSPLPSGQPFTVRLTYECSSSIGTDACENMVVESTLPAEFEGLQALGNNDVTLATYNPVTGTARWEFRSPLPLGTTGQLEFEVRYLPGSTLDGETGTITAQITGANAAPGGGSITPPPANATAQPSLTKVLVAGGASDDLSLYRINLCAGTTGALELTNSAIVDTLPPGAVYISSEPVGAYDAGAGTITWSGVSVPASGSGCRSFNVVVAYPTSDPQNAIGASKTNSAGATTTPLGGVAQSLSNSTEHTLTAPDPQLRLRKAVTGAEGTADTIIGGVITTRLIVDNIGAGPAPGGNVALNNIQIIDSIPSEYNVFTVNTGAATAVAYQRNGDATWISGVPLGASVNVASFPSWGAGDYVSRLRFSFAQLTMTERTQAVSFQSTIVNPPNGSATPYTITALAPRNVQNTATASAFHGSNPLSDQSSSATVEVAEPKARPDPRKTIIEGSPALPGGTVRYEVRLRNGAFDPLVEPVIADLLPSVFTIDPASITLIKNIAGCAATPTFTQVPDYQPGRTLLLWSWASSGCSIPADDDLRLQFNVTVADGTRAGQYPNRLALVNYSNDPDLVRTSLCTPAAAEAALFSTDATLGINTARLCFSEPSSLTVRAIASIGSAKFVRGQLDSVFHRDPTVGQTVQGGLITYQMELENTGNIDLTNLQIIDILPYNDGTTQNLGVRDQAALGTAWTVQLAGPVVVTPAIPELVIYYSSELNPCREEFTADPNLGCIPMVDGVAPGPGVWSTELPSDPTAVRSLRFDFGSYALLPLEQLRFTFPAFAPVDAPVSAPGPDGSYGTSDDTNVAWNTFAYQATRDDDGSTLVAQPPRVGITVRDSPLAAYGNYVWHDVNGNGRQDEPPTRGLNGVVVRLYQPGPDGLAGTADDLLIGEQFTRDDSLGNPGFYRFSSLEPGDYFATFETPVGYSVTPPNQGSATEDSNVDPGTLRTPITSLTAGETDLTWDAGYSTANAVSLGNRLFFDTNNDGLDNDGDGTLGSSTGISGVRVELFVDSNGNGFLTGLEQNWIAEATTDLNGYYIFTEQTRDFDGTPLGTPVPLLPNQYLIGIPASQFAPGALLDGYHSSGTTMDAQGVISEPNPPDPNLGADEDDNGRMVRFDSTALVHTFFDYGFRFYNGGVLSRPVFVFDNEPEGEFHPYATLPDPNDDRRSNLTLDFGFYTTSLGNLVWVDDGSGAGGVLADGIRNGSEPGLGSVIVELLPESGTTVLADTTTDSNGNYSFSGLPQGSYRVRIGVPAGYVSTRDTADTADPSANTDNQDNGVGSDPSIATTTSNPFTLAPNGEPNVTSASGSSDDPTLDFGIVRYYSLGNRVWADSNNDGLQNNGETGINGVTVRLLQSDGSTPALRIDGTEAPNQTTANGGYYRFDLLPAGDYIVEILETNFTGAGALRGYRSSTGPAPTLAYEPAPDPDDNADQDDNGTLAGVVVRSGLVSLGEGDGISEPTGDDDPVTNPQAGEAPNNQANRTVDFGFWPIFSLGNRVWDDLNNNGVLDAGEVGFGNVPVRLLDGLGNPATDATGTPVPAQQTSTDGYYLFTNLLAGDYIVEIDLPGGYRSSTGDLGAYEPAPDPDTNAADNDDNGTTSGAVVRSAVVTLSLGAEPSGEPATPGLSDAARDNNANYTVDFGLFQPMSLGNLVWNDLNNDGLRNGTEPGLDSVTVRLYRDSNNDGTPDGAAIQTVTTNTDGYYLFSGLGADTYLVEVVNPAGMLSSTGQNLPTPYEPAPDPDTVAIEDDDNGTRAAGVARSAPVTLTRAGEPTDDEATTPGWVDDAVDNNANYTVDFGFYTALSLGNRVWNDLNNNGIINGGESGINSVPVRLYRDNNGDGSPDDLNGGGVDTSDAIATTTTAGGGYYRFTGLSAGNYIVELAPSNTYRTSSGRTLPPPYEPAPDPDDSPADSDDNGTELSPGLIRSATVTLSVGGEPTGESDSLAGDPTADNNANLTVDFGLYRRLSLGNRVWDDLNNNGRIDSGELGLDGVTVRLYRDSNNDGTPDDLDSVAGITTADAIQTVSTISGGYYLFSDLNPDTYIVEIVPPAGYRSSTGDLGAYEGALTPDVDTSPADNDDNGTTVGTVIRSLPVTLTDGGEPTGEPVTPGWTNSSADNRSNLTVDFGLFQPMSLGNLVWNDLNNNGLIDDGANPGLDGVTVRLYRDSNNDGTPDGAAIQTVTTNADGYYLFSGLGADTYLVEVVNPAGMLSSTGQSLPTPYEPAPDPDTVAIEDDDNGTRAAGVARSAPVTLTRAGEPTDDEATTPGWVDDAVDNNANYTVDFGFYTALSLGNRVWDDGNNNGLIDDGASPGVNGVPVRLYRDNNGDGSPDDLNGGGVDTSDAIATTTTAGGGYYRFTGLSAGGYIVEIVPPAGYRSSIGLPVAPGPYEPAPDPDDSPADSDDNGTELSPGLIRSATVTLSVGGEPSGESDSLAGDPTADNNANLTVDFGIFNRVSLGNLIFIDNNNNGLYEPAIDAPLPGATVELLQSDGATPASDGDGALVPSQPTGADGLYLFSNLSPGSYVVRVTPPTGYRSSDDSTTTNDPDNNTNNDDNGIGSSVLGAVSSGVITLTSGGEPTNDGDSDTNSNLSLDFGFYQPVSVGNQIWYDANNNGLIDGGELGLGGVRVELFYDADRSGAINGGETTPIAVATTAADGTYLFTQHTDAAGSPLATPRLLTPGTYQVGIPANQLAPGGPLAGLLSSGTTAGTDGALSELAPPDPDDGVMPTIDGDDNGQLQSGGFYPGGVLALPLTLSIGGEPVGEAPDVDPNPSGRPDANDNQTVDFGFYGMSLGNLVWRDDGSGAGGVANDGLRSVGEPTLAGVTVRLFAANGTTQLDTTQTDADGRYLFAGLAEGSYIVEVDRASAPLTGLISSRDPASAGDPSALDNDDNGVTISAASVRSVAVALDAAAAPTGETDQALSKIPGMGGPAQADHPSTPDQNSNLHVDFGFVPSDWGDLPAPYATLSASGGPHHPLTTGLRLGATIDTEPDGQPNAAATGDGADEDGVTLPSFFTGLPASVSVQVLNTSGRPATLYGFIDFNGNGSFAEAGEQVSLAVPDGTNSPLSLSFNVPNDAVIGSALGARFRLSSDSALGPNGPASDGEVEDYLITITPTYSLGNRVWFDRDNSGAINAPDSASPGIGGVSVRLLDSTTLTQVTDATGALVSASTDPDGYYRFDNLLAGSYLVEVESGNFVAGQPLAGLFSSTGAAQEADPNLNVDSNDNGLDTPVAGAIRSGTITLGPGNSEPTGESDPATNPESGEAPDNRANRSVDFGFISPLSLGDLVFHDRANNGSFDGTDVGLAGATVELRDSSGNPVTDANGASIAAQITSDGSYLFTNLRPGDYRVLVTPPTGYSSSDDINTTANPNNDANDDDNGIGNSTTGQVASGIITLISGTEPDDGGESNLSLDFGFYQPLSLGDLVFHDRDNDGRYDPAVDLPLEAATVELLLDADGSGALEASNATGADETIALADQTTGADGLYRFDDLKPGAYMARVTPPVGYRSSDDISGSATPNNNTNSDDNGLGSSLLGPVESALITLSSGDEPQESGFANLTLDFGFYQLVSLGELIFEDFADDGLFNGADAPLAGALVELRFENGDPASDITGNPVASQTTTGTGLYLFSNLKPGAYVVRVTPPAGAGYRSSTDRASSADPDNDLNLDDNGLGTSASATSNPLTLRSGGEPTTDGDDANSNLTLDFGFHRSLSLGNRVFLDANNDGQDNDGDGTPGSSTGLNGVNVRLYRDSNGDGTPDGAAIQTTATNTTGHYLFTDLIADSYIIEIVPPAGYRSSTGDLGAYEPAPDPDGDANDYDDNGSQLAPAAIRSASITLAPGAAPMGEPATPGLADSTPDESANYTVDFGLYQPLSLGNRVFVDTNNDGLDNDGDGSAGSSGALASVLVRLYRDSNGDGTPDGAAIQTVSTNIDGYYLFTDLGADTYLVELDLPTGMFSSTGLTLPMSYEPAPDPDSSQSDFDDNGTLVASGIVRSAPVTLSVGGAPLGEPATPGLSDSASDENANYTLDFGFYTALSLGNRVWNDVDNSGTREPGEVGLDGVTVRLYRDGNGDGTPDDLNSDAISDEQDAIATATTANGGHYLFTGLSAGGYMVEIVPPAGYRSSTGPAGLYEPAITPAGTDDVDHGGELGSVIRSATITLSIGGAPLNEPATPGWPDLTSDANANLTIDFGLYRTLSLGDLVFFDRDNDGRYDPAVDLPLQDANLRLFEGDGTTRARDANGDEVPDETSDANGLYQFSNLSPGAYVVRVTPPAGYRSSDDSATTDSPDNDENNDDNGIGSSVAGDVFSNVITLTELGEPTNDGDADNNSNLSLDFGFYLPLSLGDLVFHDRDNSGLFAGDDSPLAGATVELLRGGVPASDADGNLVPSQTTDASAGNYRFTNLKPGDYVVRVTPPADYRSSDDIVGTNTPNNDANNDDNGIGNSTTGQVASNLLTLRSGDEPDEGGESNLSLDFGFYQPLSLGDLVFHDRDNDGQYDPAIDSSLENATVTLYLDDGVTRAEDADGVELPELITDATGSYRFANLKPGSYVVRVTPPAGYRSSDDIPGSSTPNNEVNDDDNGLGGALGDALSAIITLSSGEEPDESGFANLSLDFGFYRPLSLGELIFEDFANDGVFNDADAPLADALVELRFADGSPATDAEGDPVGPQTVLNDGLYFFNNLKPGRYIVRVTAPEGYTSSDDSTSTADPDNDLNLDDNGVNNPESLDDNRIVVSNPLTLRSDTEPNNAVDGDAEDSNLTLDFGFFRPSALGNRVWLDLNRDGIQDADEPDGVPGVTVTLYAADGTTVLATTTTDSDGLYRFERLGARDYQIGFSLPLGYERSPAGQGGSPADDSDADPTSGRTLLISLPTATTDLSWDAGLFYTAGLGNRVWFDRNANGLQDAGERGVPAVPVTLYAADGVSVVRTTSTDASGFYYFDNLAPGDYLIAFTPPAGYELSPPSQGSNRDGDSDADPASGRTALISLAPGQADPSWDAGLFQRVRLGNLVWEDTNNNGRLDSGERGLAGVAVRLFADANGDGQPDGAASASTTTAADGRYLFGNLMPGSYLVEITPPTGYVSSTGINGSASGPYEPAPAPSSNLDSVDNGTRRETTSVRSGVITLWSQSAPEEVVDGDDANGNLTLDFGLFRPAALGSLVWYDSDGDGRRGDGEPGTSGVRVSLRYADGSPVRDAAGRPLSLPTDAAGAYLFDYLTPGSYQVHFGNIPTGYTFTAPGGDSDADPLSGQSPAISLDPGERNLSLWAGLINPTAITLISFSATPEAGGIELRWATADERDSWGFHLLRSADGSRASAVRVTPQRILARGGPQLGASYSWTDPSAAPGVRYSYWLQEIEIGGRINEYGPATATLGLRDTGFRILLPLVRR